MKYPIERYKKTTENIMTIKEKLILSFAIIIALVLSYFTGGFIVSSARHLGANFFSIKEVFGCYIFALILWVVIGCLVLNKFIK